MSDEDMGQVTHFFLVQWLSRKVCNVSKNYLTY